MKQQVTKLLNSLGYPYNSLCIDYIVTKWTQEHQEQLEEDNTFTIDEEDVKIYWFEFVALLMKLHERDK